MLCSFRLNAMSGLPEVKVLVWRIKGMNRALTQAKVYQYSGLWYTQVAKLSTQRLIRGILRGHFRGCSRQSGGYLEVSLEVS